MAPAVARVEDDRVRELAGDVANGSIAVSRAADADEAHRRFLAMGEPYMTLNDRVGELLRGRYR